MRDPERTSPHNERDVARGGERLSRLPRPHRVRTHVRQMRHLHDRELVVASELVVLRRLFFVPTKSRRKFVGIWERILFGGRQGVVGVGGDGHGGAGAAQCVTDGVVVSVAADEYAHRWCMGFPAEFVVNEGDVEAELAGVLGLEFPCFQFDDYVPQLLDVEEQQVEIEVVSCDIEVDLASHECETCAQFSEGVDDAVHERLFQVAFGCVLGQFQEVEHVGVFGDLPGQVGVGRCQLGAEV